MVFSDTTNKNGIIQGIERWTGLGDAGITGDTTKFKIITASINDAYDELMPSLIVYLKSLGWDDANDTGVPVLTANMVNGTGVYTVTTDGTNDLITVFDVSILPSATATQYVKLPVGDLADFPEGISNNTSVTGVPSKVYINGNTVFFDVIPNYSVTAGIKYFFNREQYRFTTSDTTKEPGFPVLFHPLLVWIPAHEWLAENKPTNTSVIKALEMQILKGKADIDRFIKVQNRTRNKMSMDSISFR